MRRKKARIAKLEKRKAALEKPKESWYEDFGEGIGVSGLETYYGAKDLLPDWLAELDDEDRATLADWKQDAAESGWGTAGQIVGEMGQFAIPGSAVAKAGLKAAKAGKTLAKTLGAAGEMGVAGGIVGVRLPGENETRAKNALQESASAGLGLGVGKILTKAAKGLKVRPEAQELMDAGVRVTPGGSAANPAIKSMENFLEILPGTARGVKDIKADSASDWTRLMFNKAKAPGADDVSTIGAKGMRDLKDGFKRSYDEAWGKAGPVPMDAAEDILTRIDDLAPSSGLADTAALKRLEKNVSKLAIDGSDTGAKKLDRELRKAQNALPKDNVALRGEINDMRTVLRKDMPEGVQTKLSAVDKQYPKYLTVKKAQYKVAPDEAIKPKHLVQATKTVGKETAYATGKSPLWSEAKVGASTINPDTTGQLLNMWRRFAGGIPSPTGVMRGVGKVGMGQTTPQKAFAKGIDPQQNALARMLRTYTGPANLGAALNFDEEEVY